MGKLDSIGLIETVGLAAGIECADAAVKSANVKLIGYELSRGGGMVTIKISGNVSAVQAAVAAGIVAAAKVGEVVSKKIIPRPHPDLEKIVFSEETVTDTQAKEDKRDNEPEESVTEPDHEIAEDNEGLTENNIIEETDPVLPETDLSKDNELETFKDQNEMIEEPKEAAETKEADKVTVAEENIEVEVIKKVEEASETKKTATCNICNDPQCLRQKGEPRSNCVHYRDDEK
ncbi:MAG: BMC domain-containing protein [Dehalobacterium sp.]|jgi:ethanolamine utilization protein EutM